ncbi:VGLL1 isoform 3, partial [Pongo abelii]
IPSSQSEGVMLKNDKKLYVSRGSASTSLPNETLSELETPGKYSLTPPNHWGHPHRYLQHL